MQEAFIREGRKQFGDDRFAGRRMFLLFKFQIVFATIIISGMICSLLFGPITL